MNDNDKIWIEETILSNMMISEEAVKLASEGLDATDFVIEKHRFMFEALKKLREPNPPKRFLSLCDQLEKAGELEKAGGLEYLEHIYTSYVQTASLDRYIKWLHEGLP